MGIGAVSRYKIVSEPEISQGAGFSLRADARVRVQRHYEFVLGAGAKAKTVTSNLPIVRVMLRFVLVMD
jgi:hypothetical protein